MSKKNVLSAYHILELKNDFFFVSNEFNAVFQIDKRTKKISYIESIPYEAVLGKCLVSKMIAYENRIIFIPLNAEKIWIKDVKANSWKSISLRNGEKIKLKFFQAIQYNSKVYLIGCRYPSIVCLDLKTETIQYINGIMTELDENCHNNEKVYFIKDYVQTGACFYMASCKKNYIMKFDMQAVDFQLIKIGDEKNQYSGIAWDGERFWLTPRHGGIITIWDGKDDCVSLESFDLHMDDADDSVRRIVYDKNKLYLLLNKATYSISADDLREIRKIHQKYWIYECSDKTVRLAENGVFSVCERGNEEFRTILEIEKDEVRKLYEMHSLSKDELAFLYEDEYFGLSDFLNVMVKDH